jgi:hypothetical protein
MEHSKPNIINNQSANFPIAENKKNINDNLKIIWLHSRLHYLAVRRPCISILPLKSFEKIICMQFKHISIDLIPFILIICMSVKSHAIGLIIFIIFFFKLQSHYQFFKWNFYKKKIIELRTNIFLK